MEKHKITPKSYCLSAIILYTISFELFHVEQYYQLSLWYHKAKDWEYQSHKEEVEQTLTRVQQ